MSERVWTVGDAMDWTVHYFQENAVSDPRRSAEWLLSHATGLSRIEIYALRSRSLSMEERTAFREGIERRVDGEPLQYVTGEVPFRTVVLKVSPGVFIPRPETEVLVDVGLDHLSPGDPEVKVMDLCTGSGAVAISIAKESPGAHVWASDMSEAAVLTACDNVERTKVSDRVRIVQGDLFEPFPEDLKGAVDLILSNPPYIPTRHLSDLSPEVASHEPALALDGGLDGLDVVRRIAAEASSWLAAGGLVAMEVDERCATEAARMFQDGYTKAFVRQDLTGRDRIVGAIKEEIA